MASQMWNKFLVSVLGKYLAYYMDNFSKESFKLEVIKGTFSLEDMEINCQFLKETVVLPNLEIVECNCNKMHLYVPWANLSSEPIVFDLDRIDMTLVELPPGAQSTTPQKKKKKIKPSSYGFVQKCIDGIKMNVNQVNMTVKINGYRGNPAIMKINCHGIKIFSTDGDWQPVDLKESFVNDKKRSEVLFFKVMQCDSLTVSFMDLSLHARGKAPEFATFMRQVPVKIRMKVLKDLADGHVVCGAFDLVLDEMELSYTDQQWKSFMELIKGIISAFTRTDQEYTFYRDLGKDDEDEERDHKKADRSKSWWEKRKADKAEKIKELKRLEMEAREQEIERLEQLGADTSHLVEELNETTFNIIIANGVLNMLSEKDGQTKEPGRMAFARVHFEGMKASVALPPAMDVSETNKWSETQPKRLLCDASLQINNMALVLQEEVEEREVFPEIFEAVAGSKDGAEEGEGGKREKKKSSRKMSFRREKKKKKKEKKEREAAAAAATAGTATPTGSSNTLQVPGTRYGTDSSVSDTSITEGTSETETEEEPRKRLVLVTDGRSEALKKRVEERERNERKKKKKSDRSRTSTSNSNEGRSRAGGSDRSRSSSSLGDRSPRKQPSKSQQKPFSLVTWAVTSSAPEELDITKWLKSLEADMNIYVHQSEIVLLPRWWGRIIKYLETSSAGSSEIEAASLVKLTVSLQTTDVVMTIPLAGCHDLSVLNREDLNALPHLELYTTGVHAGKNVLEELKPVFAGARIPVQYPQSNKKQAKAKPISGFGDHEGGWQARTYLRKPQRFQFVARDMTLSMQGQRILNPLDFGLELALSRYKGVNDMLLELCMYAPALQLQLSRDQYLLYLHFSDFVSKNLWQEIESVLLRKYGPTSLQKQLSENSFLDIVAKEGKMPLSVNSHLMVDYLLLHVKGDITQTGENKVFKLQSLAAPKGEEEQGKGKDIAKASNNNKNGTSAIPSVLELHIEGLVSSTHNNDMPKTRLYKKEVRCRKITAFVPANNSNITPPSASSSNNSSNNHEEHTVQTGGDDEDSLVTDTLTVEALSGGVDINSLDMLQTILKRSNAEVFASLMGEGQAKEAERAQRPLSKVLIQKNEACVSKGGSSSSTPQQIPEELTCLLADFLTSQ